MRVLQGASPRGLAGIPVRRGRVIRPLLEVDRAAVLRHLAAYSLPWVEDATNFDPKFLRNRIRHELLPLLVAQGWPRVREALRRLARTSRETVEALDALVAPRAGELVRPMLGGWMIDSLPLAGLPPGAAKALLRLAIREVTPSGLAGSGLREAHLTGLHDLAGSPVGARVRLPGGLVVERARGGLWVAWGDPEPAAVPVAVPGETVLPLTNVRLVVDTVPPGPPRPRGPWEAWFDANGLPTALVLRTGRPGDRIVPFGEAVPVRVHGLLASAGVPRSARRRWPLLVAVGPGGEEVLWLLGVRRGASAPVGPASQSVIRIRVITHPELVVKEEPL
jgi:tRNA(Ile)-lysidine synthase